jgi:hypothetical protein
LFSVVRVSVTDATAPPPPSSIKGTEPNGSFLLHLFFSKGEEMSTRRSLRNITVQNQNSGFDHEHSRSSPLKMGAGGRGQEQHGVKGSTGKSFNERRAFGDITNSKNKNLLGKLQNGKLSDKEKSDFTKLNSVSLQKRAEVKQEKLIDFDLDDILDNAQSSKIKNIEEEEEEDMEVEYFHGVKGSDLVYQEDFQKIADIPEQVFKPSFSNNALSKMPQPLEMLNIDFEELEKNSLVEDEIDFNIEVESLSDLDEE